MPKKIVVLIFIISLFFLMLFFFPGCNPENKETKWPFSKLSAEDIKESDAHFDYRTNNK